MKHLLPVFILIMSIPFFSSFAQVQKKKTNADKPGSDSSLILTRTDFSSNTFGFKKKYQFTYNDKTYSIDYLGGNISDIMKNNPDAMLEMSKFRTKRIISRVAAVGVPVFFVISAAEVFNRNNDIAYAAFGCSFAMYLVKNILYNQSGRNLKKAVFFYNKSIDNKDNTSFQLQFNPVFGINQHQSGIFPGLSLSLKF